MHEEMSSSSPKRSKANRLKSKLAQAGVVGLFWLYLPELLLYACAALDEADKSLLGSIFPALKTELDLNQADLGVVSMSQSLSFAVFMPVWSHLVKVLGVTRTPKVLATSCFIWGVAMLGLAITRFSFGFHLAFRVLNGAAMASIMPLSQILLIELVPASRLGRSFGVMIALQTVVGTASASVAVMLSHDWPIMYEAVAALSILVSVSMWKFLVLPTGDGGGTEKEHRVAEEQSAVKSFYKICRKRTFQCLVLQGVFGAVPWNALNFLQVLCTLRNYSLDQVAAFSIVRGLGGALGSLVGGCLGDRAASAFRVRGRVMVVMFSVFAGIPLWGLFLHTTTFERSLFWFFCFTLIATWASASANRPICAELVKTPAERAQIISMWMVLEQSSSAIFGAPLVGFLVSGKSEDAESPEELAAVMFWIGVIAWLVCGMAWAVMLRVIDFDLDEKSRYQKIEIGDEVQKA